jgi:hypothetical protein
MRDFAELSIFRPSLRPPLTAMLGLGLVKHRRKMNNKVLQSLLNLYCIRYNSAAKRKRIYLLYFAVSLLTEKYEVKKDVIQNKEAIDVVKKQIDAIYKEIKKNEIAPIGGDDIYAEKTLNGGEFEKTMGKLAMMFGK